MKYRIKEISTRKGMYYRIQIGGACIWMDTNVYVHSLRAAREKLKDLKYNNKTKYYYE